MGYPRHPRKDVAAMAVGAAAIATDTQTIIGRVPFGGRITAVLFVPLGAVVRGDTPLRTIRLVNKGVNGGGGAVIASLSLGVGVPLQAFVACAVPVEENTVAVNDILVWESLHTEAGIADPGGAVFVEVTYP